MNWLRWKQGRQGTGYWKMMFFRFPFADCYLLNYPQGTEIPPHRDPVKSGKHYRLNILLKNCKQGGKFESEKTILNFKRVKLFRSDISTHSVSKIENGSRWILSIGCLLP